MWALAGAYTIIACIVTKLVFSALSGFKPKVRPGRIFYSMRMNPQYTFALCAGVAWPITVPLFFIYALFFFLYIHIRQYHDNH
jgi:hypothetical protein